MAIGPRDRETHEDNKLQESVEELFSLPDSEEDDEEEKEEEDDEEEDDDE